MVFKKSWSVLIYCVRLKKNKKQKKNLNLTFAMLACFQIEILRALSKKNACRYIKVSIINRIKYVSLELSKILLRAQEMIAPVQHQCSHKRQIMCCTLVAVS